MSEIKLQRRANVIGDERRRKILLFVYEYKVNRDYSPSTREIGLAIGISSTSVVNYHLDRMKDDGVVDFIPLQARTLHLTRQGKDLVAGLLKMRRKEDVSVKEFVGSLEGIRQAP